MPAKQQLRRALHTIGLEPRAVALKRAFEPARTTQDRRDHEALATIFAAALAPDACCVDVGAHSGDVLAEIVRIAPARRSPPTTRCWSSSTASARPTTTARRPTTSTAS